MEKKAFAERIRELGKRLKYPIAILLLGVVLLLVPGQKEQKSEAQAEAAPEANSQEDWEGRLREVLSQVRGAWKVEVMLTQDQGSQVIYQQDRELDTDQDEAGKTRRERTETVILSRGSSSQEAVVSQVVGPKFRGAVVVCGGGDDPAVRLAIVQAVCSVTGLGADQVTVLKMK